MDGSQLIESVFPAPLPFIVLRNKDIRAVMPAVGAKWLIEPLRAADTETFLNMMLNEERA